MSKRQKRIQKFLQNNQFTFEDLQSLLSGFNFVLLYNKGGRFKFKSTNRHIVMGHVPHQPDKYFKDVYLKAWAADLKSWGHL